MVLDERTGLDVRSAPVLAAFAAQRATFPRQISALDARQRQAKSRCADWAVRQVVRHVQDIASNHVARLAGFPSPFGATKPFDPTSTPDEWLTFSNCESPSRTMTELSRLVVEEARPPRRSPSDPRTSLL
ncbi:maleylpyruvate isomerase N-terminal domain-containing protein [Amycolatopsis sp. NPDC005232]|uniref:maleylpyruvate isomerase N-terminal domain-containing protein n=1 Tax=Amycolatopsis sp. NPDC005232 TaxID=3157027 RepID=UPI0033A3C5D3